MPVDVVLNTIIAEGAGEGEEGMYAIASAIVNRAARRKLTLEQVVNQPKQFTGRWRKDLDTFVARQGLAVEAQARRALARATQTPLPGVDHYLTRTLYESPQRPSWATQMGGGRLIGNHVFLDSQPTRTHPTQQGGQMPTLDEMKLEGPELHEKITRELYRVDKNMQAMGLGPMPPQELRESYEKVKSGVVQVVSQMKSQRRSPGGPPPPGAPPGLPPLAQPTVQGVQGQLSPVNALGGPTLPSQRDQPGAAAIHPLLDDQTLLAQRRRARLAGPF